MITAAVDKNQVEKLSGFSILAMAPDANHSLLSLKDVLGCVSLAVSSSS